MIFERDKRGSGKKRRFANYHRPYGTGKGFIIKDGVIYHTIIFGRNGKRVAEHRLIYEQHYNCCLLPNTEIHHKNGINSDNRIENLEPIYKGGSVGKSRQPPPDRICVYCTTKVSSRYRSDRRCGITADWYKVVGGGYQCRNCYQNNYRRMMSSEMKKKNNEKNMIRYWKSHERKKPYPGGPSIPVTRQCVECSSYETWINPKGHAEWFKTLREYLCKKCNERKRRKIPDINARLKATHRKYSWKPNVKKHNRKMQLLRRRDRQRANEIEKTQSAFGAFAKTVEA